MATYQELKELMKDSDLQEKVEVAVVIAANKLIIAASPTTAEKLWAAGVFSNPGIEAKKALMAVLASNASATVSQIKAALDSAIQVKVDAIVPILVDAKAGV